MPRTRELLERFRPSGTPGAAAGRGVPGDHVTERSAELEPVLDLLADTLATCRQIRAEAERESERLRRSGHDRALAAEAAAHRQAESVRVEAAVEATRRATRETDAVRKQARAEAEAVRTRAEARMQDYVGSVLAEVRTALEEEVG
jgi:hypothetical protein